MINTNDLIAYKKNNRKISMITSYDYSFANLLNNSNIDIILVGDSGVMTLLGYPDTTHATLDMMIMMTQAVRKGAPSKFIVGDMPFLTQRKGINEALRNAEALIKSGANAIKIEGITGHKDVMQYIIESGIPVMGHLGLTPQYVHSIGYKLQGKQIEEAERIKKECIELEKIGCFSIVLECIPTKLAKEISEILTIPTIGIGAGCHTDGQVLVMQDMLGITENIKPKFVRKFFNGSEKILEAFNNFDTAVKNGTYPLKKESYGTK